MELEAYGHNKISIHALREEGDANRCAEVRYTRRFLSTPSARRATSKGMDAATPDLISIHALREEGDTWHFAKRPLQMKYFYPRPPRGGRLSFLRRYLHKGRKISIHALREEGDTNAETLRKDLLISIHALREEGDRRRRREKTDQRYFYPRPPRGGRLLTCCSRSSR